MSSEPPATGSRERGAIAGRAAIVAAGTLFSRLLGLVREQVLAALFTRVATDIFFIAFLIPNVLRQLVAEGATQNGVLPVLTELREREGEGKARAFYANLRGLMLLILGGLSALGVWLSPELVRLFAGGFEDTPGKLEQTIEITRWVFPYVFFMGQAALGLAALNAHRRFVVTAFGPSLLNVAFIVSALALPATVERLGGHPLHALAIGVLVGGLLQVVVQWPSLRAIGYWGAPRFAFRDPAVLAVLRRMLPVLFGFGVYYVDVVVARHLLSDLGDGAPSYFSFAQRLCDFPQGIFVMAVQSATLPSLSSFAARKDHGELVATFAQGMRLALFAAIPASVALVVLAEPIVTLVFERGQFDAQATRETARALVAQGVGITAVAAVRQVVVVFYALGDTRSPAIVSAFDFLAFLAFALTLQGPLGHVGISWAVTLASIVQLILLSYRLSRRLRRLPILDLLGSGLRTCLAALPAALAGYGVLQLWPNNGPAAGPWLRALPPLAALCVFGLIFLLTALALGSRELATLSNALRRRRRPGRRP